MQQITFNKVNTYTWKIIRYLGNLQLAILLLLLIAILSSLGTVIEQEKSPVFYEINYPITKPILGIITSNLILRFGLDHIYSSSWFILLLVLFGLSLLSCTLSRQVPSLKLAKLWQFFKQEQNARKFGITFKLTDVSLNEFSYLLRSESYNVVQEGPYLYAYKGLIGKIGPILVHASIICILLGSIFGVLGGYVVQEIIPKGEIFHLQNIISSGPLSYVRQDFEGYVRDFKIAYSDEGIIDQFYSDVSILDNNLAPETKKTIFVNEPLRYAGITFYQTDWSVSNVTVYTKELGKTSIPLKEIKLDNNSRFWVAFLPLDEKILLVIQDLTGKCLIYNSDKKMLGQTEVGHKIYIHGKSIRIEKITPSTGLQVKSDPGIPLVYAGFSFLIVSVIFSYTSYCQLWAIKMKGDLHVYASTNRAVYFYERNLMKMLSNLKIKTRMISTKSIILGKK